MTAVPDSHSILSLSYPRLLLGLFALLLVVWNTNDDIRSSLSAVASTISLDDELRKDMIMAPLIGTMALLMTACAELLCLNDVQKLLSKKGGTELYRQAWWANVINAQFVLPLVSVVFRLATPEPPTGLTLYEQVRSIVGVIVVESFLYYKIHKIFHDYPSLYWMHKFHHQFNDVILPSTANAVSVPEYVLALLLPCLVGGYVVGADRESGGVASAIIGVASMLIHTPFMLELSGYFPAYMVSAEGHFNHHRKVVVDYGAPTIDFHAIATDFDLALDGLGLGLMASKGETATNNSPRKTKGTLN